MSDDFELLQQFVRERSDAAFEALSKRHVDLVYSAALRQTADAHLAEDVTQAVFAVLAQKAPGIGANVVLPAWLLSVTRFVANNARRQKLGQKRIAEAAMARDTGSGANEPDADWTHVAPLLDDAVASLPDADRNAVVLRFFQHCQFDEVGSKLGVSTDAAKKRVERALEKLRRFFSKKGVSVGAVGLGVLLTGNAVHAAPAALVATLGAAPAGATLVLAEGALKTMAMVSMKKIAVVGVAALMMLTAGGIVATKWIMGRVINTVIDDSVVLHNPAAPVNAPGQENDRTPLTAVAKANPVTSTVSNLRANTRNLVVLDGTASTLANRITTYEWKQTAGTDLKLTKEQLQRDRVGLYFFQPGQFEFELTVSDGTTVSEPAKVTVNITPASAKTP